MSLFGWSYPPGAANDPNAPYNQVDLPCAVCGDDVGDCTCPECPKCGSFGDPDCYTKHGLVLTPEQKFSLAWNEAHWEEQARQESAAQYHPPEEEV